MKNVLKEVVRAARGDAEAIKDTGEHMAEISMKGVEHTGERLRHGGDVAFSSVMKGINAAMSVGMLMRFLKAGRLLRYMGLSRRRYTPLRSIALVGAGVIAGAGVTMMVAPMAGRETRRAFVRGFRMFTRKGREMLDRAEAEMEQLGQGAIEAIKAGEERAEERPGKKGEGMSGEAGSGGDGNRPGQGSPDRSAPGRNTSNPSHA